MVFFFDKGRFITQNIPLPMFVIMQKFLKDLESSATWSKKAMQQKPLVVLPRWITPPAGF
jgi:hypothetical protein